MREWDHGIRRNLVVEKMLAASQAFISLLEQALSLGASIKTNNRKRIRALTEKKLRKKSYKDLGSWLRGTS